MRFSMVYRMDFLKAAVLAMALMCLATTAHAASLSQPRDNQAYTATRYPIVLIPGLMGFESLLGSIDYWHAIPEALRRDGAEVFVAKVSLAHSAAVRGEQVLAQVEDILALTGAQKVHLMGHSMGSLDARYVAGVRPSAIASVTAIGGPHGGAVLADLATQNRLIDRISEGALDLLMRFLQLLSGEDDEGDAAQALMRLTTAGARRFNAIFPAGVPQNPCGPRDETPQGIPYFSWTGNRALTNPLDFTDAYFELGSQLTGDTNDGLVDRCSTHLGKTIRDDYGQNHIDEVNLMFGLISPLHQSPVAIFRSHANRLKNMGL